MSTADVKAPASGPTDPAQGRENSTPIVGQAADDGKACAPAPLYVFITTNLQTLYARRGMWINGAPQGVLYGMLGQLVPFLSNDYRQTFYVTPDQLAALWRDMCSVPREAIGGQQQGQFLRRLREAAKRGGLEMSELLAAPPGSQTGALATVPTARTKTSGAGPFRPLLCPPTGKAKLLFQEHVMRTVREFVDFTQSSEYLQGGVDHSSKPEAPRELDRGATPGPAVA